LVVSSERGFVMKLTKNQEAFVTVASQKYGNTITRQQILDIMETEGFKKPVWLTRGDKYRIGRGLYQLPIAGAAPIAVAEPEAQVALQPAPVGVDMNVMTESFTENLVPEKDPLFVPFGNFNKIKKIIGSKMFYPVYVTGLSGNGKTFGIEQACAQSKREVIRINFTVETDEDDLIGGFRLINGDTKFFKGPIIKAMEKGAVALLDELDLANPAKVMCLQSILEGKGYFIKKTGEYVKPAPGFTVIATANTKGKGSEDGRFIGTNVMNEAFLERFPITVEQEYPPVAVEKKMLGLVFDSLGIDVMDDFEEKLVDWADIIRKTFYDGGVDEVISTRRLVHIAKAYSIFGDRMTAIEMCINRFDDDTKQSFRDLYTKVDAEADKDEEAESTLPADDQVPF
jgi:hypothetical protein